MCYLVKTKNNNYIYSSSKKQLLLVNAIIYHFALLYQDDYPIEEFISKLNSNVLIENISYPKKEIVYNYNKFLFFRDEGFFLDIKPNSNKKHQISHTDIKYSISNTRSIAFEVTNKCNLKCKYCIYGDYYTFQKDNDCDLDINSAIRTLEYVFHQKDSFSNLSFNTALTINFYGGEPLLNFTFIKELVNYIFVNHKKQKIKFSITTNGTLLNRYIDYLVENQFSIYISLDGEENSNVFRVYANGEASFPKVYQNILNLKNKYPDFFHENIHFLSVLHKNNSVNSIKDFFNSNFNKIPIISGINLFGVPKEKQKEFDSIFRNFNFKSSDKENYELDEDNTPPISVFLKNSTTCYFNSFYDLLYSENNNKAHITGTCLPFSKKLFITSNGDILPCERIDTKYSLAKVNPLSVEIDYVKIADQYNSYMKKVYNLCAQCYNNACTQCIFFLNLNSDNIKCNGFLSYEDSKTYIETLINKIEENPSLYIDSLQLITM